MSSSNIEIDASAVTFLTDGGKVVITKEAFYAEFERRREERHKELRKAQNRVYYLQTREARLAADKARRLAAKAARLADKAEAKADAEDGATQILH